MTENRAKPIQTLAAGRYLHLVKRDHWEWAQRPKAHDAVCIIATDTADHLILVEQYRYPLDARTIELPAGLVGDEPHAAEEPIIAAARRELLEETGFASEHWQSLGRYASSAGMTSEAPMIVEARQCTKVEAGGGIGDEDIITHIVPLNEAEDWLAGMRQAGFEVDGRVLIGISIGRGLLNLTPKSVG